MSSVNIEQKIESFKYLIVEMIRWYCEQTICLLEDKIDVQKFNEVNDMNKLKLFMLLFFVTSVSSNKTSENPLTNIFANFVAIPYGPVELDLFNNWDKIHSSIPNIYIGRYKTLIYSNSEELESLKEKYDNEYSILSILSKKLMHKE